MELPECMSLVGGKYEGGGRSVLQSHSCDHILICVLFATGEYSAQCSLLADLDFVCLFFFVSFYPLHIGLLREGFCSRSSQLFSKNSELAKTFLLKLNHSVEMCCFQQSFCCKPGRLPQAQDARYLGSKTYVMWDWMEDLPACARELPWGTAHFPVTLVGYLCLHKQQAEGKQLSWESGCLSHSLVSEPCTFLSQER